MRKLLVLVATVASTAFSACTVKNTEAPPLAGPSTFAKDLNLKATPDVLIQNGSDRSTITVEAKDPSGKGVEMNLRAEIQVNGTTQDFGSLSTKRRTTDSSGRTEFIYTVPAAPAAGLVPSTQVVTIAVTPEGTDFGGEHTRRVDIRLVPPGVIGPNNPSLVAAFVVAPNPPTAFSTASFDASTSTNQGTACLNACLYTWNFGDGSTSSGLKTTHEYRTSGSKTASLTVTDAVGATAVAAQTFTVAQSPPPAAPTIVVSPSAGIGTNQDVFFTFTGGLPGSGRTIVSQSWAFGDGDTGSGTSVTHRYSNPGSHTVVLTLTDDAASIVRATTTVSVTANGPTADFTFLPAAPRVGQPVVFNVTATSLTTTIVNYRFDYGDGSPQENGTSSTQSHTYGAPGSLAVTVTVTDSAGRSTTVTKAVTIVAP